MRAFISKCETNIEHSCHITEHLDKVLKVNASLARSVFVFLCFSLSHLICIRDSAFTILVPRVYEETMSLR
jgi:hypothetical protein